MANPSAGDYILVPKSATGKALDVAGGSMDNGANVRVWNANQTDAQVFQLTYRADGTAQLANRLTGKCVDVQGGTLSSGTNVQMWTDNDSRAQSWDITEKTTATVGGTSYVAYEISVHGSSLAMTAGSENVTVTTYSNANAKHWAFVPVPAFKSGGVYEIRSRLNSSMCADVASASKANGANVQLWSCNHTNAQKWVVTQETSGWSVRNVATGKYMDVASGAIANDTNVQSYEDNDTRAQRWAITTYGASEVDGVSCQVVSFGAGNATNFMLDNESASGSKGSNIQIHASNNTNAQRWWLYPTWAEDEFMPSPYNLGITEDEASVAYSSSMSKTLHPCWECAPSYATSGPNGYQIRTRTRKMKASTSTWEGWSGWSGWKVANVTMDGNRSTLTQGVALSMTDAYKAMQLEYQVRATGVDDYALLYGAAASHTVTLCPIPNVGFTGATLGVDGLTLAYTADYTPTSVLLERIILGNRNILKERVTLDGPIPLDKLSAIPASGASLTLAYSLGTDQMPRFAGTSTASLTASYATGGTTVTPTFELDGYTLNATLPDTGDTRVWVSTDYGMVECERLSTANSSSVFAVPFPMGAEYRIFATGHSSTSWFAYSGTRTESAKSAHVWGFDGGTAVLEVREGTPVTTQDSIEADSESWMLDSRPYETIGFGPTRKHRFTAVGALCDGTTSARGDFELLAGTHALYRSPAGDICPVAVLSVDREAHANWTEVSVTMAREAE